MGFALSCRRQDVNAFVSQVYPTFWRDGTSHSIGIGRGATIHDLRIKRTMNSVISQAHDGSINNLIRRSRQRRC